MIPYDLAALSRRLFAKLLMLMPTSVKAAFVVAAGAVVDGDKGDITVGGSGTTLEIDSGVVGTTELADDSVTLAKIQEISENRILGASVAGNPIQVRVDGTLQIVGGVLELADADKGDITVGSTGTAFAINNGAVTEAKQTLADNTTNDVSTTKHGYAPKAPNDTTKFLRGDATWAVPADTDTGITELTGDVTAGPGSGSQAATLALTLDEILAPAASINFADQQALSFRIENRTSDPGSPTVGQLWLRTDL